MNHEYVSTSNQSTALVAENAPCSSDPVASATGSEESATGDFYFGSDTRILSELDPDALDRAPLSRPGGPDAAHMMVAAVEHGSGVALGPGRAGPSEMLALNRSHWEIENRVHYVRDFAYDEDRSRARAGRLPRNLACLSNAAISIVRMRGRFRCRPLAKRLYHGRERGAQADPQLRH